MNDASQGNVLVVDDEPGVRDIVKTYLEYGKMNVTAAADGDEALRLAEKKEFDVVLSDIMMPRMNGLTLASEIHRIQPDTMIILMTGYASVNTAVEAIKRDVFDYILKPFQNMQLVLQAVRRGVERKRLLTERKTLVEDLRRTNEELAYHRQLLMEKVWKTDNELARRIERLSILYDISRTASSITLLKNRLGTIAGKISEAMNGSSVILWLFDEERGEMERTAMSGGGFPDDLPDVLKIEEGDFSEILRLKEVRIIKDTAEIRDAVLAGIAAGLESQSLVIVPLCFEDRVIGVFTVFFRNRAAGSDDDISMLVAVADQTAVTIKNSELYENQQRLFRETIEALATAIDSRDHYTGGHSYMVTQYALAVAKEMGFEGERLELVRVAGLLHDIGKIGISDAILNKPGKLTDEEMGVIKAHPILGRMIIESIEALKPAARIVYHHHEHYDGSGYPEGIKGEDIPLESRILQVADIFHALTSDRIYRKAMPFEKAISIIREEAGTNIDPEIGKVFLRLIEDKNFLVENFPLVQMA